MATRRLTDAFLLLRNNSIQNRQLLAEQVSSHTTCSPLHSRSIAAVSLPAASPTHAPCALRLCLFVCLCLSLCLKKKIRLIRKCKVSWLGSESIDHPGWGRTSARPLLHLCLALSPHFRIPPSPPPTPPPRRPSLRDPQPPIYICFSTKVWKLWAFLKPFRSVLF